MPQRSTLLAHWATATLIVTAPSLGVLLALAAAGWLPWLHAAAGQATIVLITGLVVRRHIRDLSVILSHVERLIAEQEVSAPHLSGRVLTQQLLTAIRRLNRAWRDRADALRRSIAINESLLDSLPDPIILLDSQRRVLFSNAAARQHLGGSGVGRDLAHLVRDPRVLENTTAVLRGVGHREVTLDIVDPAERHFAVRIEPLQEETAGGGTCVIAMVDLTAMKRIEDMRSDFIANASHELRTPLSSLIGFIETLRGPARDDPKAREQFLELMHQQAQRMARLVRDLLSLSMIEMSEHLPPSGDVDLKTVLRNVADTLQLQAQSRGVKIDLQIADDLPTVTGDSDQLTQLFQNLIDNAIKYGGANGTVTVTARVAKMVPPGSAEETGEEAAVRVAVADEGEGIPKEHLPRLTERFYRVDAARSRAIGGTGLGLAIVKHIVARHRGQLRIESDLGRGSNFIVYLPVTGETPR